MVNGIQGPGNNIHEDLFKKIFKRLKKMEKHNYLDIAKNNEEIFRKILQDLKENRSERPMGMDIPEDLDTKSPIDLIYQKYSEGVRDGVFTILNFERPDKKTATISFQNVGFLSGGGTSLNYEIDEDGRIKFQEGDDNEVWLS